MRRRCLDFEVLGKRKKDIADDDKQTLGDNKAESSSKCVVPGIGLHLNAIPMSSKAIKINTRHEGSASVEVQKSFPGSITPVHSQDIMQETLVQAETEAGEGLAVEEETPKPLVFEELNQDSLQKKKQVFFPRKGT